MHRDRAFIKSIENAKKKSSVNVSSALKMVRTL